MISTLYSTDPAMTATGLAMLALFCLFALGIPLDRRMVTGAPVWLKPTKFALSIATYLLSLAFVEGYVTVWPGRITFAATATTALLMLEMVLLVFQAARGVPSHFNTATPIDSVIYRMMGLAIAAVWAASVVFAAALWVQKFDDEILGTALRLGMTITVLGSASGGAMTSPTSRQLAEARETGRLRVTGAHTVGGPDGGPGLPFTNWSTGHGDLRIAHFVGLHAMQVIPLLALLLRRAFGDSTTLPLVWIGSAAYLVLFLLLGAQAYRGVPLVRFLTPDRSVAPQ